MDDYLKGREELGKYEFYRRDHEEEASNIIKDDLGIELNWVEKSALKHYVNCFYNQRIKLKTHGGYEAAYRFMYDYFDLNFRILGSHAALNTNGKEIIEEGMNLLGTPEFKQYCRDHVQMWREQREFPQQDVSEILTARDREVFRKNPSSRYKDTSFFDRDIRFV